MLEYLVLGLVQGVFEWLPVSSEGMILLVRELWFNGGSLTEGVRLALFLHLGTVLAAIVYFYEDVWNLIKTLFQYKHSKLEDRVLFWFLFSATLATGVVGGIILYVLEKIDANDLPGRSLLFGLGVLLLITAGVQLRKFTQARGRSSGEATIPDGLLMGLVQGLAGFPGLSRSGSTVAVLLLRKFSDVAALRLSFLASIPIVIGGNIVLNYDKFYLSGSGIVGLIASFLAGIATIHVMLLVARKVSVGYFVLGFAILVIAASFI